MSDTPKPAMHIVHGEIHDCMPLAEYLKLERELAALREENERLREDAERYRWLRGQNKYRSENVRVQVIQGPNWVYPSNFYLDAAIDAARKEGN